MTTSIHLNSNTEDRLDRLSKMSGHTKDYLLNEMIENGLDDLEDYYLSEKVAEKIKKGEERVHSLEEVREHLEL